MYPTNYFIYYGTGFVPQLITRRELDKHIGKVVHPVHLDEPVRVEANPVPAFILKKV